ncbi:MAG: hypothetical protein GF350_07010 [Chitinivibrionales bacterium]|nr:hypothetical protein [Chitinivibrionales bacterium]
MKTLGRALRSLEETLQEPELRLMVEELLPQIDNLYAKLLALELRMILWAEGSDKDPLLIRAESKKETCFNIFEKGPHILAI